MKRLFSTCLLFALSLGLSVPATAAIVQIQGGQSTAPANWNVMGAPDADIIGMIDSEGNATGIDLITDDTDRFNGINSNGSTAAGIPPEFPAQVTGNSWYGNTSTFGGGIFPEVLWTFQNLDQNSTYDFTFYASRTGVSDNRETTYSLTGGNTGSASLAVSNNISETAFVGGITPDALGQIQLVIGPGANNDNGNGFFYLGGMTITSVTAIPEPSSLFALGTIAIGGLVRRRSRQR
ncbi:PEP-CTERM sorting domain-containing protein [Stieleria sp. JC731]|uniref:PEP-CTERM sorting domain-containing protein n=1 Tax=Pirellulaceae TaxID=2691357 RepID=UPI001E404953|nr:PEP-CTERM sorting domain-containing protein [Stieleria sp. JC731]MCC9603236.1 PEP-CTERM sorting domain-containing protein [Stieleria sp. JC731]